MLQNFEDCYKIVFYTLDSALKSGGLKGRGLNVDHPRFIVHS